MSIMGLYNNDPSVLDMMVFPGKDHGMGGTYYVNLIHDYFTDHLK